MKKFIYIIPVAFVALMVFTQTGCRKTGFLDKQSTIELNEQTVFADSAHSMDFLAGIYNGMLVWRSSTPTSDGPEHHLDAVTDEATQRYPSSGMFENQIITGSFGGTFVGFLNNSWSHLYTKIRAANVYLNNVERAPITPALKARTSAEARFLRAYFYSLLMEGWGGVPIVGDTVYSLEASSQNLRSTYEACVDYVVGELDAVAQQLPNEYTGLDYGRITKGACLALKSRVLLFAASPLYNGGSVATDPALKALTGYVNADPQRWQKALQAAQDVVNLNKYQLEIDNSTKPGFGFYQVFLKRINNEYILPFMMGPNVYLETYNLPPSRSWWNGYHRTPTQNLVDAFPMANGKSIDNPASGYNPNDPYVGREPRFYYSIIYNGSGYYNRNTRKLDPVYTYQGSSPDGIVPMSSGSATHTGYYYRKMMDELIPYQGGGNTNRCLPIIRYAEILLNLAEAANETGNTTLAMQQLHKIRERAGIPAGTDGGYGFPVSPSKEEARELIRRERFIELAFEGKRFFDIKRWKAKDMIEEKYSKGMQITKVGTGYTYNVVNLQLLNFEDKLYMFPIPQGEISANLGILQNPGW